METHRQFDPPPTTVRKTKPHDAAHILKCVRLCKHGSIHTGPRNAAAHWFVWQEGDEIKRLEEWRRNTKERGDDDTLGVVVASGAVLTD